MEDDGNDGLYPMRVVTRLSGLPADTIRAWERRYGAVRPARTEGKARRYSEAEVRRLVLLREATEKGHAIGSIGGLDEPTLAELVRRPETTASAGPALDGQVAEYLERIQRYDVRAAEEIALRAAALLDAREFCLRFLVPALEEIGRRWEHGAATVVHEHLVSTHVKRVLGVYLRLSNAPRDARKVAFLTPEKHIHEFGIHIGAILCTQRGLEPVVLGPDVPYDLIPGVLDGLRPAALVFGVSRDFEPDELARFGEQVARLSKRTRVLVGCPRGHALVGVSPSARHCHEFEALDAELALLALDPS